jgi:hypothetical protein
MTCWQWQLVGLLAVLWHRYASDRATYPSKMPGETGVLANHPELIIFVGVGNGCALQGM